MKKKRKLLTSEELKKYLKDPVIAAIFEDRKNNHILNSFYYRIKLGGLIIKYKERS